MRLLRPIVAVGCCLPPALMGAGCGGGERQDANERSGTYEVKVAGASFPQRQAMAQRAKMTIAVKNTGSKAIPDLAVTVDGFSHNSDEPGLADPGRPTWIVDAGPVNGDTAYVNTWALGRLAPGATRTFTWRVTAVQPGRHTLRYRVAAGLDGKAKAQGPGGQVPGGSFTVAVSNKPGQSRVDPGTGNVVPAS